VTLIAPLFLASCGAGTSLTYPPAPAFMAPVALPDLTRKSDMRPIASQLAASLAQANSRLKQSRAWYDGISTQGK
jgi:hypothetical protein